MATVLLTWELGGGMAHLVNLLPLARGLRERGHRVFAALRHLSSAETVFGELDISYLQAPVRTGRSRRWIEPARTFAHVLYNTGFDDASVLRPAVHAWKNLYKLVQPDLLIFDHSPTALLAARGCPAKKVVVGPGFCCPSDESPLRDLRPWLAGDAHRLRQDEAGVLANANQALDALNQPPVERLGQLYREVDDTFLLTFAELDPYAPREGATYRGTRPVPGAHRPEWPEGPGKRVFAYLRCFPALPRLLALLDELKVPTIVCAEGIDPKLRQRFDSEALRFEDRLLDLAEVGRHCDLAILNGNHGTTAAMLLAGKPVLQVPINLEQTLNSIAVERLGAGLGASGDRPEQIAVKLMALLSSRKHTEAARQFAARYASFDPQQGLSLMLQGLEELLP